MTLHLYLYYLPWALQLLYTIHYFLLLLKPTEKLLCSMELLYVTLRLTCITSQKVPCWALQYTTHHASDCCYHDNLSNWTALDCAVLYYVLYTLVLFFSSCLYPISFS